MLRNVLRVTLLTAFMGLTVFGTQMKASAEKKEYAVARVSTYLNIREEASISSTSIGKLRDGGFGRILSKGKQWTKIQSGDITGYVSNDYIITGKKAEAYLEKHNAKVAEVTATSLNIRNRMTIGSDVLKVASKGDRLTVAKEYSDWAKVKVSATANGFVAKDYVDIEYVAPEAVAVEDTNIVDAGNVSKLRRQIIDFACQHVGNPYVYGGTSLTNGADCSGFVMRVFEHFGYQMGRSTYDQIGDGKAIKVKDVQPGDLIFYGDPEAPGHVAIYIGNQQIVHASTSTTGIIISAYDYREPCAARRIVNE
ncbi:MAG: NlpC/P60 family protein [Lachnospiraceae bacterium]